MQNPGLAFAAAKSNYGGWAVVDNIGCNNGGGSCGWGLQIGVGSYYCRGMQKGGVGSFACGMQKPEGGS